MIAAVARTDVEMFFCSGRFATKMYEVEFLVSFLQQISKFYSPFDFPASMIYRIVVTYGVFSSCLEANDGQMWK